MPGSITWNEFCKFIKKLEEGVDGRGPSFLDVVRMRWIVNMGHGLRTNCCDRGAVQKFVRRTATIWGVPDSSTPIGRQESVQDEPASAEETAIAESAQILIDLYRGEAAADDQMNHPNYKENQYLQATEASLVKIYGSLQCASTVRPLQLNDAQKIIHAYPELEPNITEIIDKLNPNSQVKMATLCPNILLILFSTIQEDGVNTEVLNDIDGLLTNRHSSNSYLEADANLLNRCQKQVLDYCITYFHVFKPFDIHPS